MAVCLSINVIFDTWHPGFGMRPGGLPTPYFAGCDVGPYRERIVRASAAGVRARTAGSEQGIDVPAGGRWRVVVEDGSSPVVSIRFAEGLEAPQVDAQVGGRGHRRTLRYDVKPLPGQKVTFRRARRPPRLAAAGQLEGRPAGPQLAGAGAPERRPPARAGHARACGHGPACARACAARSRSRSRSAASAGAACSAPRPGPRSSPDVAEACASVRGRPELCVAGRSTVSMVTEGREPAESVRDQGMADSSADASILAVLGPTILPVEGRGPHA
jgi:hypothetical protein